MLPTGRWATVGRAVLSASALVILAPLPELLTVTPPAAGAALLAGASAFVALWLWFWWRAIDSRTPAAAPLAVALMAVLLTSLTLLAPPGRDGLLLAALAAGAAFPARRAAPVVAAVALLAGALQIVHGAHPLSAVGIAVDDLVVGAAGIGGRLLLVTNLELARARDEIARLAVGEERLRFGRDLHDLLGQDLTLAVLKSELVARDLPGDTPDSVRALQAEVATAVRQALDDVRAAVADYRRLDLATELAASRSALDAAGVELSVEDGLGELPPVQESTLAWVLRESVTNVLRHSRARRCAVRLEREGPSAVLQVEDDGRGGAGDGGGSGSRGIAERVAALGGSFDAAPTDARGYRVRVSVPLPPS
jgi:two-component system sensor histidine kinase DesK